MKLAAAISTCFAVVGALSLATEASAQITLDFVHVGDPGNPNDPETGWGAVSYEYRIGKYEVTLHQYTTFLNAVAKTDPYGLYNPSMGTDSRIAGIARSGVPGSYSYSVIDDGNRPVTYVTWLDAARFANWLHNGQPIGAQGNGTTETGAYTLNGDITGGMETKNGNAQYWIPSENEWYKAAYYQPAAAGGDSDGYWFYAMGTNSIPYSDQPPGAAPDNTRVGNFIANDGLANGYDDGYAVSGSESVPSGNMLTPVGAYTASDSYYRTFDQGGNVFEWNDTSFVSFHRGVRGGSWNDDLAAVQSSFRTAGNYAFENPDWGFRIATVPPPSPAVFFQHTGSTEPSSEGWQADGIAAGATAGPINDAGTPAWFSNDTSTAGGSYRYYLAYVTDAQAASATSLGWTLTTRVRVTAASTTTLGSPYAGFADGPRTYSMFFAGRANGDVEVSLYGSGLTFTVVGGMSAYHVFSLVYDPVAGSADLFVDGVERLSNYTGIAIPQQLVDWGTGSSGFDGSANFNLVKFSITRPLPAWRQLQGLSSNGSQDLASPSGDGIANLLKYAFNMAPNAGDLGAPNVGVLPANGAAGLPSIGRDGQGRLVVEFIRRHADTKPGVTYTVETGDDLGNLQPLSLSGATVVPVGAIWERVTVTDPVVTAKRFGRLRVQASETYTNDFNAGLGTASLRRDAVWTNQAVQLTDAIQGQMGAVVLEGLEAWPAVSGFTAKFNATLGPTSSFPADGLSFSVGNLGTDAWAEAGPPTSHHLSIGFDTHENGVGDPEASGIHLWVNGTHVAYNPTNPYTYSTPVPVEVSYDTTTGVTVRFNGVLIFNNVAAPGFSFQPGDRFGFGGRTGFYDERKVIDDVEITTR